MDTNILVSAFGWSGPPRRLFELVLNGEYELAVSKAQIRELERVLGYPRLGFSAEQKKRFFSIVLCSCTIVDNFGSLRVVSDDPSDDVLLETAVEHGANWLVTGDRHLLKIREFRNVRIVTPAEFLALAGF